MLHQLIVLLIVKTLLTVAIAVKFMLRVSHCELETVGCVHKLIGEDRAFAILYL